MEIRPFKAYRFNPDVVGNTGDCISPPYDVIDTDLQERLYRKNEYNIVRIIQGKLSPSDNGENNQYTRAARFMDELIDKGAIKQDPTEAIYGYVQDFEIGRERCLKIRKDAARDGN